MTKCGNCKHAVPSGAYPLLTCLLSHKLKQQREWCLQFQPAVDKLKS